MSEKRDYAIINTGGKQYRVAEGDSLEVELLGEKPGSKVVFSDVLLVRSGSETKIGTPLVDGASVEGKIEERTRGDKVVVFKKKRRKGYKKTQGHRQDYHVVTIDKISTGGASAKKSTAKADTEDSKQKPEAKKAAKKPAAKKTAAKKTTASKTAAKKPAAKKKAEKDSGKE